MIEHNSNASYPRAALPDAAGCVARCDNKTQISDERRLEQADALTDGLSCLISAPILDILE